MYRPCSACDNKKCKNDPLHQPQCFSCQHWIGTNCTIYGLLESNRGCCEQFKKIELVDCLEAVIHRRDDGIRCTILDTFVTGWGCHECYQAFMARAEKEDS